MVVLFRPSVGVLDLGDLPEKGDHLAEEARELGFSGFGTSRGEEDEGSLSDKEGVDERSLQRERGWIVILSVRARCKE
jgi:hypothetical protein